MQTLSLATLGLLLGLPLASFAAQSVSGNQPVDISAAQLDVDQKTGVATFSGGVTAVQGATTLTSSKATVTYARDGVDTINALGNVRVVRNNPGAVTETATGDAGTYRPATQVLTLTGKNGVDLQRGQNTLHGKTLTYNLASGQINLSGGGGVRGRFVGNTKPGTAAPVLIPGVVARTSSTVTNGRVGGSIDQATDTGNTLPTNIF